MSTTTSGVSASTDSPRTAHDPALDDLRRRVAGLLHTPYDPDWDLARMPWLVNVEQTPLAVLEVHDADDVQAAVRWAAGNDAQVSAQPTGHGTTGAFDRVLLLRTGALAEITVDLERRTAWVGAGVKAGALCEALDGTGLTYLCGSNPDPSVVGMTVQGGISWFSRAYGLGADSIVALELVDGMGRLRRISADEDAELFWAVRGSGGDFGIITRMELRLHPAPQVYGGRLLWPVEQMASVLRAFRAVTAEAPDELTVWYHTYRFPPMPEVPEPLRGRAFASIAVAFIGEAAAAERWLAPFRAVPDLVMDLMGEVTLAAMGSIADEPTEPMPGLEMSALLDHIDDRLIDDLVTLVGAGSGSPLPIFQIRHLGGAFRTRPPQPSSFGAVEEEYNLFALGVPAEPALVEAIQARFEDLESAIAPYASGRSLLAFLAGRSTDRWWSPETRARLVAAKDVTDPLHTIRSNRPVHGR